VQGDTVISAVMKDHEELLEKVSIFDVYEGKGIPEGKKSLGLRFCYRSLDHTLTDEEVNQVHGRTVDKVMAVTGASIRGVS
jgi:phenylalanyl-tRNA synthetase beta chain